MAEAPEAASLIPTLLTHGTAIIVGVLSGLGSTWVKERAQSRRERDARSATDNDRRRDQIREWRRMVVFLNTHSNKADVRERLHTHSEFLELEPYLTDEARQDVEGGMSIRPALTIGIKGFKEPLDTLHAEIARLEREWGLD